MHLLNELERTSCVAKELTQRRNRRGLVLGLVVLLGALLGVFLFSYHRITLQQNIKAHHELLAETVDRIALSGVRMFSEWLNQSSGQATVETFLRDEVPELYQDIPMVNQSFPGREVEAGEDDSEFCKIVDDFNLYLQQMDLRDSQNRPPECLSMGFRLDNVHQLYPEPADGYLGLGRDGAEKFGNLTVFCTVTYGSLVRKASIKRQIRIASMIPGPMARFSLFVPFTPDFNSYNAVGTNLDGNLDGSYRHRGGGQSFRPLKVFNGTDSFIWDPPSVPDAKADLANRGWIYLGPAPQTGGAVLLKVAAGYELPGGGMFHFAKNTVSEDDKVIVPSENLEDPAEFFLGSDADSFRCVLKGVYQGFYTTTTKSPGKHLGDTGMFPFTQEECASSWLFPFGDYEHPSRTLIIGPVLAGFVKFYAVSDYVLSGSDTDKVIYKSSIKEPYGAQNLLPTTSAYGGSEYVPKFCEIFLKPAGDGIDSFKSLLPFNFCPHLPGFGGVPFNVFFDTLDYPGSRATSFTYPNFKNPLDPINTLSYLRDTDLKKRHLVPAFDRMKETGNIPGLHPANGAMILLSDGPESFANTYYKGDLGQIPAEFSNQFSLMEGPTVDRVSHLIDLSPCQTADEERNLFATQLFTKTSFGTFLPPPRGSHPQPSFLPPLPNNDTDLTWYLPKTSGIFLVKRNSALTSSPLELPGKIFLAKPFMLMVEQGDIAIPNLILSELEDEAPKVLCSLIAVNGNIFLGTEQEIDAFLIAFNPSAGGRLKSGPGVTKMNIFGGLSIWEMGLHSNLNGQTTMENFPDGGTLRYNPRFNPAHAKFLAAARTLLLEDREIAVEFSGAGES